MRSLFAALKSLVLPAGAGPGQARMVIGQEIPQDLKQAYSQTDDEITSVIVTYNDDQSNYTYIASMKSGEIVMGNFRDEPESSPFPRVAEMVRITRFPFPLVILGQDGSRITTDSIPTSVIQIPYKANLDIQGYITRFFNNAYMLLGAKTAQISGSMTLSFSDTDVPGCMIQFNIPATVWQVTAIFDVRFTTSTVATALGSLDVRIGAGPWVTQPGSAVLAMSQTTSQMRATVAQTWCSGITTAAAPDVSSFRLRARRTGTSGTIELLENTKIIVTIYSGGEVPD